MRSRSKVVLFALATVAVAGAIGFGAGRSAQASRPAPPPSAAPEAKASHAEWKPAQPAPPEPLAQMPQPSPQPVPQPAPQPAQPTPNGSLLAETPPEAIPAVLAAAFEAEPVDRAWATTTSVEMRDGARLPGVQPRDVSCRSSMCRVDVRAASDGPAPRAFFDAMCVGPDSKWAKLHVGCYLAPAEARPSGERDVTLFVFRDGRIP